MTREQKWAIVRLTLGMLQVMSAATAAILLFRTGVNELSLGAAGVAGLFTLISIILFRNREPRR